MTRTDTTTGLATDTRTFAPPSVQGRVYDLGFIENESSGLLHREYAGVTFQGQYRFGTKADIGGSYTLSHLWGNVDGENVASGPLTDSALQYPETKRPSGTSRTGISRPTSGTGRGCGSPTTCPGASRWA